MGLKIETGAANNVGTAQTGTAKAETLPANNVLDTIVQTIVAIKPGTTTIEIIAPLANIKFDQLDMLDLVIELEKKFNIKLNDEAFLKCLSLDDVYAHVATVLGVVKLTPTLYGDGATSEKLSKEYVQGKGTTIKSTVQKAPALVQKQALDQLTEELKKLHNGNPFDNSTDSIIDVNPEETLPKKKKWKKNYTDEDIEKVVTNDVPIDHKEQVTKMLKDAGQEDDFVVVVADANTLQIDLDEPENVAFFNERYAWMQKEIPELDLTDIYYTRSKSMRWHVTITLKTCLTTPERILLQALLGSDSMRETMSYLNFKRGHVNSILLLERKEEWEKQKKISS
jgi:acyl carrier protein